MGKAAAKGKTGQPEYVYPEYWENMHRAHPGSLRAVGYEQLGDGFNRVAYEVRLAAMRRLLSRQGSREIPSVLEAGVGVGAYAPLWDELRVKHWMGVDISRDAVSRLEEKFPDGHFRVADIAGSGAVQELASRRSFRLVTAIDVLYHIVDDGLFARSLRNLADCVDSEGYFACTDVFVQEPRMTAAHVKRRPLEQYSHILGDEGFRLIGREKVFAVLGDPVPRPGMLRDLLLFQTWRIVAKTVRSVPSALRSRVGAGIATALVPLDAFLRKSIVGDGVNLEIALFQRTERRFQ